MRIIRIIVASLFLIYGLISLIGVPVLYLIGFGQEIFSGIKIYKVPGNIIGGIAASYGGFLAIKYQRTSLVYIGISILIYIITSTYEIVMKHGLQFYNHIMFSFFESAGLQIALFIVLIFCFKEANKALNADVAKPRRLI